MFATTTLSRLGKVVLFTLTPYPKLMSRIKLLGAENIPAQPSFYLPNRITPAGIELLHRSLQGKLCVLYAPDFPHDEAMVTCLSSLNIRREKFDFRKTTAPVMRERVLGLFHQGLNVLFLPGCIARSRGCLTDVPSPFLTHVGSLHISPVPVFTGFYSNDLAQIYATSRDSKVAVEQLCILPKLKPGPYAGDRVLEAWLDCGASRFAEQDVLSGSLTTALVRSLSKHGKLEVTDGMTGSKLPYFKALGVAMTVAKVLEAKKVKRIGVILPPGAGSLIAMMACLLAKVTPIMINYASSRSSFESTARQAECTCFITAQKFMDKLPTFAWPSADQLVIVEDLLENLDKKKLIANVLMARVAPAALICKLFATDDCKGDDEAILLFTSGSSDEPKGVALSHRMVLANVAQCASRLDLTDTNFLGSLPVFHSFGLTVTMMLPLLTGHPFCTYPSPTEAKKLCSLTKEHQLSVLCATPTFARAMLHHAKPGYFDSVRYFIVGAEKLQNELRQEFKEKHNVELLEGYGLTEATPVCAVNLHNVEPLPSTPFYLPSQLVGSIGNTLPGIAVRLTNLDDDSLPVPLSQQGMIWVKGPNVFKGYVGKPELNEEIFQDGWFKTGDIGHMDLNGFIFLDGRLSRFSKIGGEMVPHEGVEKLLTGILNIDPNAPELQIAVTSVSDSRKGEALVLLSTLPEHQSKASERESLAQIRADVAKQQIPNIWIPKYILAVEGIPVLPTGKLDLRGCKELAKEALYLD